MVNGVSSPPCFIFACSLKISIFSWPSCRFVWVVRILVLILKHNTSVSFQMDLQTVLMVVWLHFKAQNKNLKRNHNFWWSSRNSLIALVLRNSMWVEFFVVYRKQKNWSWLIWRLRMKKSTRQWYLYEQVAWRWCKVHSNLMSCCSA